MSVQPDGNSRSAEIAVPEPLPVPLDRSYEIELDNRPDLNPVPVDITRPVPALRPVIPMHLRSFEGVRAAAVRHARVHGHRAAYHASRSPVYLLLSLAWAVVGVFRLIGRQLRWWWVIEQHTLRHEAAAAGDSREWMRLHKEAKETRKYRGFALLGEAAVIIGLVVFLILLGRWWADVLAAAAVLPLLARHGRPADRPIIGQAVVMPRFRVLNADIVLRAYYAAKLGDPDKPGQQITFGTPMAREGEGSGVDVDLPYGKGLDDAIRARPAIASGLDVTESQVFIHRDPTSHRRHHLWVADRDPLAVPVGRTPLRPRADER